MQIVMSSPLAGAEITTFFAPAVRCLLALSLSVKRPVLSSTSSTPRSFQGSFSGSLMADTLIDLPLTISASPLASTVPGKRRCTESYFSRCASVFVSVISVTPTNSRSVCWAMVAARSTLRPMRPKPLIPTRTAMSLPLSEVWNGGAGEGHALNARRAGLLPCPRCLRECRAGGENIVHENQRGTRKSERGTVSRSAFRVPRFKRPRHIRQTRVRCQRRLRRRLPSTNQRVKKHRNPPPLCQRAREHVALIVAALAQSLRGEGNRDQGRRSVGGGTQSTHGGRQIVGDARQAAVLERVHGLAGALLQPHRRPHGLQRTRPRCAETTRTEIGLGLPAAIAPGRTHRSPALAADGTHDAVSVARREQRLTHQALGRKQKLLDRRAKHGARAARRRASPRWVRRFRERIARMRRRLAAPASRAHPRRRSRARAARGPSASPPAHTRGPARAGRRGCGSGPRGVDRGPQVPGGSH